MFLLARLAGFEPATDGLEVRCSIQLSYRRLLIKSISYVYLLLTYAHLGRQQSSDLGKWAPGPQIGFPVYRQPAHTLGVPVLHGDEEPTPAFLHGEDLNAVGTPRCTRLPIVSLAGSRIWRTQSILSQAGPAASPAWIIVIIHQ